MYNHANGAPVDNCDIVDECYRGKSKHAVQYKNKELIWNDDNTTWFAFQEEFYSKCTNGLKLEEFYSEYPNGLKLAIEKAIELADNIDDYITSLQIGDNVRVNGERIQCAYDEHVHRTGNTRRYTNYVEKDDIGKVVNIDDNNHRVDVIMMSGKQHGSTIRFNPNHIDRYVDTTVFEKYSITVGNLAKKKSNTESPLNIIVEHIKTFFGGTEPIIISQMWRYLQIVSKILPHISLTTEENTNLTDTLKDLQNELKSGQFVYQSDKLSDNSLKTKMLDSIKRWIESLDAVRKLQDAITTNSLIEALNNIKNCSVLTVNTFADLAVNKMKKVGHEWNDAVKIAYQKAIQRIK